MNSSQIFTPAAILMAAACLLALGCSESQMDPRDSHRTTDGFRNPEEYRRTGFVDFLKWRWQRLGQDIRPWESYNFPLAKNEAEFLRANRELTTLTWIGHATVLLQLEGLNILTDPHFSERASPVQWAGPKRVTRPGIPLEELPPIDIVVLSHDHYDSLDTGTVKRLIARKGGENTTFCVPMGLKKWFEDLGATKAVEFDWWESRKIGPLTVTATPVRHWSKRAFTRRNETLWAGWVVSSDSFRFFFAGDSGYTPMFAKIGERLGPFDLCAIPIGAYEPRWFMKAHHLNPEDAVQVHKDVRSGKSVAIHWGTFILTDEPLDEPPKRLAKALERQGLAREDFVALKHGQTIRLKGR